MNFKPHHHVSRFSTILLQAIKEPLALYFIIFGNGIMFFCAYIFFIFEYGVNTQITSYWDALWWALCTVSTVGYGDLYPITSIGRLTGAFLIITGVMCFLASLAVLVSIMTTAIAEEKQKGILSDK